MEGMDAIRRAAEAAARSVANTRAKSRHLEEAILTAHAADRSTPASGGKGSAAGHAHRRLHTQHEQQMRESNAVGRFHQTKTCPHCHAMRRRKRELIDFLAAPPQLTDFLPAPPSAVPEEESAAGELLLEKARARMELNWLEGLNAPGLADKYRDEPCIDFYRRPKAKERANAGGIATVPPRTPTVSRSPSGRARLSAGAASTQGDTRVASVLSPDMEKLLAEDNDFGLKAAIHGFVDLVRAFVDRGGNVRYTDERGQSMLHLAAVYGRAETCSLLLGLGRRDQLLHGMNNAEVFSGCTAMHLAAEWGHATVCRVLLGDDAFTDRAVNARDQSGWTALVYAARNGHAQIVQMLLEDRRFTAASTVAVDAFGWNALYWAAQFDHADVCAVLCGPQSNFPQEAIDVADRYGRTPLHIAAWSNSRRSYELLSKNTRFASAVGRSDQIGQTAADYLQTMLQSSPAFCTADNNQQT